MTLTKVHGREGMEQFVTVAFLVLFEFQDFVIVLYHFPHPV